MLPASYGQSSLYVLVLMESPQRLFIVRSYSSCLDKVQQSNSLKENSPLMLTFPLCSFPCLKPCLFRFHQCEEHERRAVYKVNITSFFVENPSYPHYSRLGRHIWIQVKAFKYFRDVDPYGMIVLVSAGTELTLFLVAGTVLQSACSPPADRCPVSSRAVICASRPTHPCLYTGHDILWYGIPLWLVRVSCPGHAPSQLLAHLLAGRAWETEKSLT